MFKAIKEAAVDRSSRSSTRRSSAVTTPYESAYSGEFSSSDDSDLGRRPHSRRRAVTRRKPKAETQKAKLDPKPPKAKNPRGKSKKQSIEADFPDNSTSIPTQSPNELVKIAKKEGTTKFQQMRKFLSKANESDKPQDMLAGILGCRGAHSPTRSSFGSVSSPRGDGFHTGLTPRSSSRRMPSPSVLNRRDSEDGFAAADLLATEGNAVEHKLGSFLHGQRSLNLRLKSRAVGAGDNLHLTALLVEDIPDIKEKIDKVSRSELRQKILLNTAEDEADKENLSSLDDSQICELDMIAGL